MSEEIELTCGNCRNWMVPSSCSNYSFCEVQQSNMDIDDYCVWHETEAEEA